MKEEKWPLPTDRITHIVQAWDKIGDCPSVPTKRFILVPNDEHPELLKPTTGSPDKREITIIKQLFERIGTVEFIQRQDHHDTPDL